MIARVSRFLLTLLATALVGSAAATKPNVIIIFTDDQGYQDLGCFGSPDIKTPHIDQMAKEGMRLTDFYSAASVCTPSRAALLTGCYPERVGNLGVLFPNRTQGLNPDETTIARMLKDNGYATACVGKWHLGHHQPFLPTSHGFDSYFGIPYSNDMGIDRNMQLAEIVTWRKGITEASFRQGKGGGPPLMRGTEVIECPADQATLTKRYTEEAIAFIQANKDNPFFLYLPHTMPHIPLFASPKFAGTSEAGLYGDCIEEIDWSVGRILDTLRNLGIDGNTLVVYTSDNGPWKLKGNATSKVKGNSNARVGGSALPLNGYKFSKWEGGMRVPAVAWWPGRIPAGVVSHEIAGTIDLLPTIAAISGAQLPVKPIDGKNILPLLENKPDAASPHQAYFYRTIGVRSGNWKLLQNKLYNLAEDISETTNVAGSHPEIVARLKALLDAHRTEIKKNARPAGSVDKPRPATKPIDWAKVKLGDVFSSNQAPPLPKKAIHLTGTVEIANAADQILLAHGGTQVGYSLYLADGNLVFAVSTGNKHLERIQTPAPNGTLTFAAGIDKQGYLFVSTADTEPARIPATGKHWIVKTPQESLSIGFDEAHPVDPQAPTAKFNGKLVKLTIESP